MIDLNSRALNEIAGTVIAFAEQISEKTYYPYQTEIASAVIRHMVAQTNEDISALLSRQSGKSTIMGDLAASIIIMFPALAEIYYKEVPTFERFITNYAGSNTGGVRIGIYTPIFNQSTAIFHGMKGTLKSETAKSVLKELGIKYEISRGDTITLSNNSRVLCASAGEGSKVESATHDTVFLDEAQDTVSSMITKSIRPMLANTGGNAIYIGTPGTQKWDFYTTIELNKIKQLEDGVKRHFEFDWKHCARYNKNYKIYVEKEIEKYGYESDAIKLSYRLIWLLERGAFCTDDMMYGRGLYKGKGVVDHTRDIIGQDTELTTYAGVDFGKESDSTVVTIIRVDRDNPLKSPSGEQQYIKYLFNWLEIQGDDYETQYWRIVEFLKRYKVDVMCCDATSQGDPVVDRFKTYLPSIDVEPIKFSEKQNSEMFKLVQQEMMAGRLKIPYNEIAQQRMEVKKFIYQILALEKSYRNQYLKVSHPKIRGAHDDYLSSLALALWATRQGSLPDIEESPSLIYSKGMGLYR